MRIRVAVLALGLLLLSPFAFAQVNPAMLSQFSWACRNVKSIVPMISLVMFIMAAGIYALGQTMGAETRGRAAVWSMAMLVGGALGLIIAASAQFLMETLIVAPLGGAPISFNTNVNC